MIRNWFQVRDSDAIYAIGKISYNKVEGGTGYAVQMAINNDKPIHVFDQKDNTWKIYDKKSGKFVKEDTPTLTKNYAGIGTREITPEGIQAIKDVYTKTFGEPKEVITPDDSVRQISKDVMSTISDLLTDITSGRWDKELKRKGINKADLLKEIPTKKTIEEIAEITNRICK